MNEASLNIVEINASSEADRKIVIDRLAYMFDENRRAMVAGRTYHFGSDVKVKYGLPFVAREGISADEAKRHEATAAPFVETEEGRKVFFGLANRVCHYSNGDGTSVRRQNVGTFVDLLKDVVKALLASKGEADFKLAVAKLDNVKFECVKAEKLAYHYNGTEYNGYFYELNVVA